MVMTLLKIFTNSMKGHDILNIEVMKKINNIKGETFSDHY